MISMAYLISRIKWQVLGQVEHAKKDFTYFVSINGLIDCVPSHGQFFYNIKINGFTNNVELLYHFLIDEPWMNWPTFPTSQINSILISDHFLIELEIWENTLGPKSIFEFKRM